MVKSTSLNSVVAAVALTAVLSACSSVTPSAGSIARAPVAAALVVEARYQPAPTLSVLVVPGFVAGREAELIALAKTECAGRTFCSVGFWAADAAAPRRLKMSGQQVADRIVQFAVNGRTGLSKATWNCKVATQIIGDCA